MTLYNSSSSDLTTLFKSCIKTIKTRNKAIGISLAPKKIFTKQSTTKFLKEAKEILSNIYSHNNLLNDYKNKYLFDSANSLSDVERIYMDKVLMKNLKIIEENIRNLEKDIKESFYNKLSAQALECYKIVIIILKDKCTKTNLKFGELKDFYVKKKKEKENFQKFQRRGDNNKKAKVIDEKQNEIVKNKSLIEESYMEEVEEMIGGLSEEEQHLLQEENDFVYEELMSNREEVKQITKKVVELGRMQDFLTENVEIQAKQIDDIHETILHSTDNVQRGNEQVREAMRKDAGFRVWIMFFLIIMSFSILFLDWYNP